MKIALLTSDKEIEERVKRVVAKFPQVELTIFESLKAFMDPFSNIYRLIIIDYALAGETAIESVKRMAELNPDGWIIALSPNLFHTYDLTDAGAKITIMRNSMDLLESVIEGIVNPKTPEEVEKKYGYTGEEE